MMIPEHLIYEELRHRKNQRAYEPLSIPLYEPVPQTYLEDSEAIASNEHEISRGVVVFEIHGWIEIDEEETLTIV